VSDNINSLVLEHMRAIRAEMARMADYMHTLQAEMTSMRQSLDSVRTLQDHDHGDIAALKLRVERIERRLDLVD
jgi:capsule polysaccharide export protein KpsE/RkpR